MSLNRFLSLSAFPNTSIFRSLSRALCSSPPKLPSSDDPFSHPLASLSEEEQLESTLRQRSHSSISAPRVYVRDVSPDGRSHARGSRKRSVAFVALGEGTGSIVVNQRPFVDYFPRIDHRDRLIRPLLIAGMLGKMDIECQVKGGGPTGQAEAIRHAVARAVLKWDPVWRAPLKKDGLLTRDPREVESKKYGKKKARKSFQWVKR